jgi:hypothetical protein
MQIVAGRQLRLLDFDIENRPLSYWYDGNCTAEVTSIAWAWFDRPADVHCTLLTRDVDRVDFEAFLEAYNEADGVVGHYIRNHDLLIIQGALIEFGLPTLGPKLTSDTKNDLIGFKDIPKTQEHLCEMLGVASPKVQMSQVKWRSANRLTNAGVDLTRVRAVGDVVQNIELRKVLLERGLLGAPKVWRP